MSWSSLKRTELYKIGLPQRHLEQSILGVSNDVPKGFLNVTVITKHSTAVNCMCDEGMRWSFISDEEDFQPRSVYVSSIPSVNVGEILSVEVQSAPILYDVQLSADLSFNRRWVSLVTEWIDLGDDPELGDLAEAAFTVPIYELSGLGPGLTPAGDDYITGWITANRCIATAQSDECISQFRSKWKCDCTTWFSQWMILDADRGRVWKRGKDLLSAIAGDDALRVTSALSQILNWGHTSGRAWLAGFARGFYDLDVI